MQKSRRVRDYQNWRYIAEKFEIDVCDIQTNYLNFKENLTEGANPVLFIQLILRFSQFYKVH